MRSIDSSLQTYLATAREARLADLWTIALSDGTVLRWSGGDRHYRWDGQLYALGPGLKRGAVQWSLSLDTDELELTIMPRASDTVGSAAVPLAVALRRGDFDGARVRLSRAFGVAGDGSVAGVIPDWFTGELGPLEGDGVEFVAKIRSPLAILDAPFPANIVQAQCANRLFDEVCRLDPASFRISGSVTGSVSADRTQFATTLGYSDDNFTLGRFRWLTGANAGLSASVRKSWQVAGVLKFASGWPSAVVSGDTFEIWPGCDKRQTTCSTKFSNLGHFRGIPFVPAPETTT